MKVNKVGSSKAALLAKLGITPFSYGLIVLSVYENGPVFNTKVLDLIDDDLIEKFSASISLVTSLSLGINYPILVGAPHMFINVYKNALVIAVVTEYSFPQANEVTEYLKDPTKFAAAAAQVAAAESDAAASAVAKEEEKKEPRV